MPCNQNLLAFQLFFCYFCAYKYMMGTSRQIDTEETNQMLVRAKLTVFRTGAQPTARSKRKASNRSSGKKTCSPGFLIKLVTTVNSRGRKSIAKYYGSDGKSGVTGPHDSHQGLRLFPGKRLPKRLGRPLLRQLRGQIGQTSYTWP